MRDTRGTAVVLITQDLGVDAEINDRVAVGYAGRVVETGSRDQVLAQPEHPLHALSTGRVTTNRLTTGNGAHAWTWLSWRRYPPAGCFFAPRCAHGQGACADLPLRSSTWKALYIT